MTRVLLGFLLGLVVAGVATYAWTDKGLNWVIALMLVFSGINIAFDSLKSTVPMNDNDNDEEETEE